MEKNYEFKVGDKVKIREDSDYYLGTENNPEGTTGTVTKFNEGYTHIFQVDWGNGWENCYRDFDLELVNEEPREELVECSEEFPVNVQPNNYIRHICGRIILDKESFILKDFTAESPIPEGVDINDWRTWKVGDRVEMLQYDAGLSKDNIYPITDLEWYGYGGDLPAEVDGEWPLIYNFRWHSRPSK